MNMQRVIMPFVPIMKREKFAELSGLRPGTVQSMIENGQLPTVKVGRHRMVNVYLLFKLAAETEYK
jgi:excisionase family DNA binding protein